MRISKRAAGRRVIRIGRVLLAGVILFFQYRNPPGQSNREIGHRAVLLSIRTKNLIAEPERHPYCNVEGLECAALFQLKSKATSIGESISDAGYRAMIESIMSGRVPNLFVLHYEKTTWTAKNVLLVPHYVFSVSVIQRRKPLSDTARRAGWIGCNILLRSVPPTARIDVVVNGSFLHPSHQRKNPATTAGPARSRIVGSSCPWCLARCGPPYAGSAADGTSPSPWTTRKVTE